jgi:amino acid transporter
VNPRKHLTLLFQAVCAWAIFWVAGLPSYYQQYSLVILAVGCILLTVAISLAAVFVLRRTKPENRLMRAFWLSFYYTIPLAAFDALYCGVYLGHGVNFLYKYWYLSVFYVTPWLTFIPTAILLREDVAGLRKRAS